MPFKLDTDRIRSCLPAICKDISVACMPVHLAAQANGIPARSFERYWAKGQEVLDAREDPEVPLESETENQRLYADLAEQVRTAQARKVRARLSRIAQGLPGWQGSGWILERSPDTREMFSPPTRVELTGANGGPLQAIQVRVDNANEGREVLGLPPLEVVSKPAE